jgi:hypothetical protein
MALNDVYSIVLTGQVLSQLMVNVFHYRQSTAGTADLSLLALAANTAVRDVVLVGLSGQANYTKTEVLQVTGGSNYFVEEYTAVPGGTSGECLPPAVCFTYKYVRAQLGRRHGYKRFSGVLETAQTNGIVAAALATYVSGVAAALAADLVPSDSIHYKPVVLHKMLNGQPVVPPVAQDISTVIYSHLGTQNSRKFGRGR